jgi:hypothetical protein
VRRLNQSVENERNDGRPHRVPAISDTSIVVRTQRGMVSTRVLESSIDTLPRISEKIASTMRNGDGGGAGGGAIALQSPVFMKYSHWYPGLAPPPRL